MNFVAVPVMLLLKSVGLWPMPTNPQRVQLATRTQFDYSVSLLLLVHLVLVNRLRLQVAAVVAVGAVVRK